MKLSRRLLAVAVAIGVTSGLTSGFAPAEDKSLNPKIQDRILCQSFLSKLCEFSHCLFRLPIGTLICIAQQLPNRFRNLAYLPGSDAVAFLGEA